MGVATADYDNDGLADIFVAGVNGNTLYRNLGNGRFADITDRAGLAAMDPKYGKRWAVAAGWFDYDNDGWLDLFVSNYVAWDPVAEPSCSPPENRFYCHPNAYHGLPNQLFHNNGDGTFTDVSATLRNRAAYRKGNGRSFADFDRRRIHRRVRRQRLGAQFSVPESRRRHVPGNRASRPASPCAKTVRRLPGWAWISAISTTTAGRI